MNPRGRSLSEARGRKSRMNLATVRCEEPLTQRANVLTSGLAPIRSLLAPCTHRDRREQNSLNCQVAKTPQFVRRFGLPCIAEGVTLRGAWAQVSRESSRQCAAKSCRHTRPATICSIAAPRPQRAKVNKTASTAESLKRLSVSTPRAATHRRGRSLWEAFWLKPRAKRATVGCEEPPRQALGPNALTGGQMPALAPVHDEWRGPLRSSAGPFGVARGSLQSSVVQFGVARRDCLEQYSLEPGDVRIQT